MNETAPKISISFNILLVIFLALIAASMVYGFVASAAIRKESPPVGAFETVGAGPMHFRDFGAAQSALPPVVLIHGASANLRDMELALGTRLAETRRVVIVDRPGHGYSRRERDDWRLARQAEAIRAVVVARGLEQPIIVGQSFGGAVALAYALQFQRELSGTVLLAPVSHEWPGGVAWYNTLSGAPGLGMLLRRSVLPLYGPYAARSGVTESFAPNAPPDDYVNRAGLKLLFRPATFRANAEDLRHLKSEIIAQQSKYTALSLPITIAAGADDTTVSPVLHAKALAMAVPGARLVMFENTGHALHHAQTDAIVELIDGVPSLSGSP
ncbi:MAG: alpha/beta hydrolase [Pseudomonadota bacterium]